MSAPHSNSNPHISDKYSPLETLVLQALRRYGEFTPDTVDGDVMMMFIEFANQVVDDVRQHPYYDDSIHEGLPYYVSASDRRPVPDGALKAGLLAYYAIQQQSPRMQTYLPLYHSTMNQQLWHQLNGNTQIRLRQVDGGTSSRGGPKTSAINGLDLKTGET